MKIAIVGSMSFHNQMLEIERELIDLGHEVIVPEADGYVLEAKKEDTLRKIANDYIRKYFYKIETVDAILVVNIVKNGINDYIGSNSFLEIGFAHVLNKKIFLLNQKPNIEYIDDEFSAMCPICINQNLHLIM